MITTILSMPVAEKPATRETTQKKPAERTAADFRRVLEDEIAVFQSCLDDSKSTI